jgi:hypothetical protein
VELAEAVAVLERTPAALAGIVGGLPPAWTDFRAGADEWSPYQVVGHLLHGDRTDWLSRARQILESGTARAFEPFDREGMRSETAGLDELLVQFARLRSANLSTLAELALGPADLDRRGLHPDLGEVTLGELVAAWAVHDLSHVAQVAETMAKRYREAIGPWREYLPVVDREDLGG